MKSKIKLVFNNVAEIVGNEQLGLLALTDEAQTMELLIPCDKEMKEQLGLRLNHLPITKMLLPEVLWQLVRSFSSDDFEIIIDDIIDFGPLKEKISDLVNIQDYNGDGHPDIAVRIVGAYTQSADELYLFNPATRQFQTPPDGQGIAIDGNVEVIRKGCIRVEYKSSIMDYDEEDYCWKNGGWEMLRLKNAKPHKKPKGK